MKEVEGTTVISGAKDGFVFLEKPFALVFRKGFLNSVACAWVVRQYDPSREHRLQLKKTPYVAGFYHVGWAFHHNGDAYKPTVREAVPQT